MSSRIFCRKKYEWKFRTVEGLNKEISSVRNTESVNSLYWRDQLRVCEAYSIVASYRMLDLARSYVQSLEIDSYLGAAIVARSAFEGTVQYLDLTRAVCATLEQASDFDFQGNLVSSEELERFLVRVMFASRQEAAEEIYRPTNILTLISNTAKIRWQEWVRSRYETLSEIVHPNF